MRCQPSPGFPSSACPDIYLRLIDLVMVARELRVPNVTFVGIQSYEGGALLLVNGSDGSTRSLVTYDREEPVDIIDPFTIVDTDGEVVS